MRTKLAGATCHAPSGMYLVSGYGPRFDLQWGQREGYHSTKHEPPSIIKCMFLTNHVISGTE